MPKVADIFVGVGVKGDGAALKSLGKVNGSIAEIRTSGLAAKAAILGMVWATEKLFSGAADKAHNLKMFEAITGEGSGRRIQELQYAASKAGVAGQEIANSLTSIQTTMGEAALTGNAPIGLQQLAASLNAVGDSFDFVAAKKDPFYVFEKINKYINTTKDDVSTMNRVATSFGVTLNSLGAMRQKVFTDNNYKEAARFGYSDSQITGFQKLQVQVDQLHTKWEKALGTAALRFAPSLFKDLHQISDQLIKMIPPVAELSKHFIEMVNKLGVIEKITTLLQGVNYIADGGLAKATEADFKNVLAEGELLENRQKLNKWLSTLPQAQGRQVGGDKSVVYNIDVSVTGYGGAQGAIAGLAGDIRLAVQKGINDSYRVSPAQTQKN